MDNLYLQEGFARLKNIKPLFNYENWYFSKVIDKEDILNIGFYTNSFISKKTCINTSKIKGTTHSNYNNIMWIEMLGALGRFNDNFYDYSTLLNFINTQKEDKSLNKYGDYYMIGDGNHRFCLAKFLELDIADVVINEFEFNEKYYKNWTELKNLFIEPVNFSCHQWILHISNREIRIHDSLIHDFIKLYEDTQGKNSWLKAFEKDSTVKFNIKCSNDLRNKELKELIIKNKNIVR